MYFPKSILFQEICGIHHGTLGGMKKLLAKGENGKFWASDFNISGSEMVGLSYMEKIIRPTGVTKETEIMIDDEYEMPIAIKVKVKEWELIDYNKLKIAYDAIMTLAKL